MNLFGQKPSLKHRVASRGEKIAADSLKKKGYHILEKNYRCPLGEVDLIAEKNKRLFFVEVKTRTGERYGSGKEAVHEKKQHKIAQLAQYYLKAKRKRDMSISLSVVSILLKEKGKPEVEWIPNAFEVKEGHGRFF